MYALVEFLGKQYKVEKGSSLKVDKINAEPGSSLDIDKVLLVSSDKITVGNPYVQGAKVSATETSLTSTDMRSDLWIEGAIINPNKNDEDKSFTL